MDVYLKMEGQNSEYIDDRDIYEDTAAPGEYIKLQKTSPQKNTRDDEVKLPVKHGE